MGMILCVQNWTYLSKSATFCYAIKWVGYLLLLAPTHDALVPLCTGTVCKCKRSGPFYYPTQLYFLTENFEEFGYTSRTQIILKLYSSTVYGYSSDNNELSCHTHWHDYLVDSSTKKKLHAVKILNTKWGSLPCAVQQACWSCTPWWRGFNFFSGKQATNSGHLFAWLQQ